MDNNVTSFYRASSNVGVVDADLRQYMLRVFSYMAVGLGLTAVVAYFVGHSAAMMSMVFSSPGLILGLAVIELGLVLYLSARISSMSVDQAKFLFLVYSAINGVTLAPIFVIYTGVSITTTFFVAASMFLSMVVYGYVTDKDLTSFGSFLIMGLIGLIIASVINIFLHSSVASLVISAIGVVLFTGLTAYDAQRIKSMYFEGDAVATSQKKAIFGALCLYLDFINLFIHLLKFVGVRRD